MDLRDRCYLFFWLDHKNTKIFLGTTSAGFFKYHKINFPDRDLMQKSTYQIIIIGLGLGLVVSYFAYMGAVEYYSGIAYDQGLEDSDRAIINRYYNQSLESSLGYIDGYADGVIWGEDFANNYSGSETYPNGYNTGIVLGYDLAESLFLDENNTLDYIAGYGFGYCDGAIDGFIIVGMDSNFRNGFIEGFLAGYNEGMADNI